MIAGVGGLVGREMARQWSGRHQVTALKREELDISDALAVRKLTVAERPSVIINCAVVGLDACERDQSRAWKVNVVGTENLARAAAAIDAEFLHISTNYVFDGEREINSAYTLNDNPAPINRYGKTKLASERAARSFSPRTFIVRTSWVFGNGKNNFFSTAHISLKSATPVNAITDVWAGCTYVRDLVARIEEILSLRRYTIYQIVNGGVCSYYDFALEVAQILNLSNRMVNQLIQPVTASEIENSVKRPRFTPMRCIVSENIGLPAMRDWRIALAEYIHSDDSADLRSTALIID